MSVGYLIRDAHLAFARILRSRLQPYGLTPGQWYFLRALWEEEGLSQRELSRRVGTTEPTTASALRLLVRDGLVERVRNRDDRRTINIFLTERGRSLQDELIPKAMEVNGIAVAGIDETQIGQLDRILRQLKNNLDSDPSDDR